MNRLEKLQKDGVCASDIEKLLNVEKEMAYIGRIGEELFVFYCDEYDQIYIYDPFDQSGKTIILEEYENLVNLKDVVENRFNENEKKRIAEINPNSLFNKKVVINKLPDGSINVKGLKGVIVDYNSEIDKYRVDFGTGWEGHFKYNELIVEEG